MSEEEFLLKWNDHHASFFNIVEDLCRTEQLCDVTLACGGQVFETHKLILSVCSPYFRTLLNRYDKHPIVYLKDVNPKHLEQLLSYMYRGEINVLQNDLGPLIETARGLQIKGLADAGGGGGGGGGEKKPQNGPAPKRARTATPNPPSQAPKVPKIAEQPPKSLEMSSPATAIAYSPVTVPHPEQSIVKQEEDDSGWTEESIPNESYEQDMQLEDEQYIQSGDTGGGLSGQQIMMLQKEIQKKYPCEFCQKRFPTPSKLHRHKLVHSGEKPYICTICLKGFTQKVHLNTHRKLSHPETIETMDSILEVNAFSLASEDAKAVEYAEDKMPIETDYAKMALETDYSESENQLYIHTDPTD